MPKGKHSVFPVSTGMNRGDWMAWVLLLCVPRKHGDEPITIAIVNSVETCSP